MNLPPLSCLLALALLLVAPAYAADSGDRQAGWDARLAAAKDKQARGKAIESAASKQFEAEHQACFKKFLINDCQREVRLIYNQAAREGRLLENEGDAEERQVRKEMREDEAARYAADAPKREADLRAREIEVANERAAATAKRDQRRAEKEAQAAAGRERRARDEERQRQKQEEHQRKVQKKIESTEQPDPVPAK